MSTPRRPTAERQQQIAEAALRIISGKGVHRLTTQELAREVGISDGSLFRHFKDKAEIIRAAIGFLERTLFEGFPPQADDPLERLRLFFVRRLELVQRPAPCAPSSSALKPSFANASSRPRSRACSEPASPSTPSPWW